MRTFLTWFAILILGLALGIAAAVWHIRSSGLGNDIRVGPWSTGRNVGTADADLSTRAIVALRGLLALPPGEARYFTATTDSAGRMLDGRCYYTLQGGFYQTRGGRTYPARWLSITVYDQAGWLIPNPQRRHSVGSWFLGDEAPEGWTIDIGPTDMIGRYDGGTNLRWIPTGTDGPFELTLRAYRPLQSLTEQQFLGSLPTISAGQCPP
jgi:hypothetical protein